MGNTIGGRKRAKVMKINGEIFKIKTPVRASDVVNDYPGHVLLESKAVKQFGIRAAPLEPQEALKPKKIYFLIELPKLPEPKLPRRARTGVHMTAKDRLESLMSMRRSVSDLSITRQINRDSGGAGPSSGPATIKLRLPKTQLYKMIEESRDEAEVGEKIMDFCLGKSERVESDEGERLLSSL